MNNSDPLKVLSTTKIIIESSIFVQINPQKLDELCKKVSDRIDVGLPDHDSEFFSLGNIQSDVQIVFLENVVNFCFWAEKGLEKWKVEYDGKEEDGASGLPLVFERAMAENIPIISADYLENLSFEQVKKIFRPSNGVQIPLIEKRHEALVEAGKVLNEKFDGLFYNLIKQSDFDAVETARKTVQNFKSFDDTYNGVNFYKRAQLNAFDIAQVPGINIKNTDKLTAMADYKLPQLLRFMGVLEYSDSLAKKIDNCELIDAGSREEIEIRSATVWAVELVSQKLGISAGLADRAIWWLSRELDINQLYHRSYSTYY